jgi:small-conductance mechanosensitive channel
LNDYGWALLAVIGIFVFSLYIWSYLSKRFDMMRAKEGKYTDSDVIDFLDRMIKVTIILVLTFSTLWTASLISEDFREDFWNPIYGYALDIILVAVIVMIAMLIVRILRRLARRARIKSNTETSIHPSAVEFTSLFMSYVVYALTGLIVIIILISLIPNLDLYDSVVFFLQENGGELAVTAAIVIAIYFLDRLVEAILEDFKFRTKKFSVKEVDLLKMGVRYALLFIAALTAMFSVLSLMGLEAVGFVLVIVTLVFLCLALALSYSTIQNVAAGFGLMDSGPFNIGDRIRIRNGMVCDVVEKGLVFTRVRALDGEIVDIPNAELIDEEICNYTLSGTHGIPISFQVSYEIPHEAVEKIMKKVIDQLDGITKEHKPELFAKDIIGNRILYDIVVYTKEPTRDRRIRSNLIFKLQEEFHKEGHKVLFESS